jgi:tetratricopeptide (TPR) repeat protein
MERPRAAVHRTIILVDVEGFGDRHRTNHHQVAVREGLYSAVRRAFDAAGISWADCDHEDRGDGVFILAPAQLPKAPFAEVLPRALAEKLHEHNTTHGAEERIRLRMALHAGEVAYDEHGVTAASVNLAFRLLDAPAVKTALAESPGVLAVIASGWFFQEVIRHCVHIDPASFLPATVAVKETVTTAWVGLPDHPYPPDPTRLTAEPPAGPVPHQLPAAPGRFIGRTDELAILTAAVNAPAGAGGTVVITAIAGAGGMGKTWLALRWAHEHLDRFPDGQMFVDLRGFSADNTPMPPEIAVRGFLEAFGIDTAHIPVDLHSQAALFRSLVAGKRMLIVLDNAVDAAQVAPLLPGSSTTTVLVTSRNHLPGLITAHGAHHLRVDILTDTEARALLSARLGADRVAAEPTAVDELVAYCGGLPLALSIVAGRARTHSHLPLDTFAAELREVGLDALDDDDPTASLPAVLSWSVRALTADQARAFGLLGIAPGPDIGLPAAASLTGWSIPRTRAVLRGLDQVSLLGQDTGSRYRVHDLIRRFAADHAGVDQMPALRRLVDFYLHTAYTGEMLLDPDRPVIQLHPPAPGCRPDSLPDYAAALEWFEAEQPGVQAAQQVAAAHGWHQAVWQLAWSLFTFHSRRGHFHDEVAAWRSGLAAAMHLGDRDRARAHHHLGRAYALTSRHGDALDHLHRALTLAEHVGDQRLEAHTHRMLAVAAGRQGDDERALKHATRALHCLQTLDNRMRETEALNAVAWYAARLGHYDQARANSEAALAAHRERGYRNGVAAALNTLAYVAHHTGRHTDAIDYYQEALTLRREQGNVYKEAEILDGIGQPHCALGRHDEARAAWRQALRLYEVQHRSADAEHVLRQLDALDGSCSE